MTDKQIREALIAAVSACVHYQEYSVSHNSLDRIAAESALQSPALQRWCKQNAVLMPLRRDGKSIFDHEGSA